MMELWIDTIYSSTATVLTRTGAEQTTASSEYIHPVKMVDNCGVMLSSYQSHCPVVATRHYKMASLFTLPAPGQFNQVT